VIGIGAGRRARRVTGIALAAATLAAGVGCGEKEEPDLSTVEVTETAPTVSTPTTPTTPTTPGPAPTTTAPTP
jgi:hypothetical protein